MCLITDDKTEYITKRDKTVYKILVEGSEDNVVHSPIQYHTYELGKLYTTTIKESNDWTAYGNGDTKWLNENYPMWRYGGEQKLVCIGEGYHSISRKIKKTDYKGECLYKCVIPKGSVYHKGPCNLIVSNQIIIKEKVS